VNVHYAKNTKETACGIDRGSAGEIRVTWHRLAATCPECQNTDFFRVSRQHIPEVQGGPYRG